MNLTVISLSGQHPNSEICIKIMHESDDNPTTSSYNNFNAQVIIFYLFSIIFRLILSHGLIFCCIYCLQGPLIPSL